METSDIKEALIKLGFNLSDRGSYWQTNAIFRNGDNQTAIQIYKDTGVWKDYVEDTCFFPFKKLVQASLGTNDPAEINSFLGKKSSFEFNEKNSPAPKIETEETYALDCLERLLPHYDFYEKKGISLSNLQPLKGGLATTGQLNQRFVFPIFNKHGKIHGFSGRDMKSGETNRPKWKHLGRKKNWIYPLYVDPRCKEQIENKNSVIIVESIGDMLALRERGHFNVLPCFGLSISNKLTCAMVQLNPKHIFISLNNDKNSTENRGEDASFKNYLSLLGFFDKDKIKICLPNQTDFGEMSDDDFRSWEDKYKKIKKFNQVDIIIKKCNNLAKNKKISKSLSKKIKLLQNG
jgi:hypothetical protein